MSRKQRKRNPGGNIAKDFLFMVQLFFVSLLLIAIYVSGYDRNWGRMAVHWGFIFAHLYMFGVKRFTVGNINGFDLLFGAFYLYFWWQNPWGFIFSYFAVGYVSFAMLRLVPIRDETGS